MSHPPPLGYEASAQIDGVDRPWIESVGPIATAVRPAVGATPRRIALEVPRGEATPLRIDARIVRREVVEGSTAVVHQHLRLADASDRTVGSGAISWILADRLEIDVARSWRTLDVGTVPWGEALTARLATDPSFAAATGAFDGTIAIGTDDRQVQFRIYRGRILEAVRKTVEGSTFAVTGSDHAWTGLLLSSRDDFVRRTSEGAFNARGSSFQYLRMFKAVSMIAIAAKRMREERMREEPMREEPKREGEPGAHG